MKRHFWIAAGLTFASTTALAEDMLTPGLYEIRMELLETNMPMAPRPSVHKQCITQADIERDPESTFYQQSEAQQCDTADFHIGDGNVSMKLHCPMPGGDMTITMSGSYTATSYEMTNHMQANTAGMSMSMRSKSTAKRIGDCH